MLWQEIHQNHAYEVDGVSPVYMNLFDRSVAEMERNYSIMEVGAGTGRNILYARQRTQNQGDFLATDVSSSAVDEMVAKGVEAFQADMRECPVESGRITHAISWRAIHHLPETGRSEAVDELRRVIRPGGQLIMAARSFNDWSFGIGTQTEKGSYVVLDQSELPPGMVFFPKTEYHAWHFFAPQELRSLLEKGGFDIQVLDAMSEQAGIPTWYKGENAYWVIKAEREKRELLWRGYSFNSSL